MILTTPQPFAEAVAALAKRRLLPTTASARELNALPAQIREHATFSAKVSNLRFLDQTQQSLQAMVQPEGRAPGTFENTASARLKLKQILTDIGYTSEEGKAGTIEDLSSNPRLNLIIEQNVASLRGYGWDSQGKSRAVLDAYPAQELFRAIARKNPRDWRTRWVDAGGQLYGDRMIAPKDSPVWSAISRFNLPYPPFDYASGMRVRDIGHDEAVSLGVITAGQTVDPAPVSITSSLQANVQSINPDLLASVSSVFGDAVRIAGNVIKWVGK
jgi:hypothetical protein